MIILRLINENRNQIAYNYHNSQRYSYLIEWISEYCVGCLHFYNLKSSIQYRASQRENQYCCDDGISVSLDLKHLTYLLFGHADAFKDRQLLTSAIYTHIHHIDKIH